jgi:hypothetical protein
VQPVERPRDSLDIDARWNIVDGDSRWNFIDIDTRISAVTSTLRATNCNGGDYYREPNAEPMRGLSVSIRFDDKRLPGAVVTDVRN